MLKLRLTVADGPHSVILNQVTNGIAVRMAVMSMAMSGQVQSREYAESKASEMALGEEI